MHDQKNHKPLIEILKWDSVPDVEKAMKRVGAHPRGIDIMAPKGIFQILKIHDLTPYHANVLKQEMLSMGAEAATGEGCVNCTCDESDVILFGTLRHFEILDHKLRRQSPFFHKLADSIKSILKQDKEPLSLTWKIRGGQLDLSSRTLIMGILNVTPDSFSDGGKYVDPQRAVEQALNLSENGADILDIGGESTRPGSDYVDADEEMRRVLPVLEALQGKISLPISIDTHKASVAEAALERGAAIINDVTALGDEKMAPLAARYMAGVVLMHMLGEPKKMQQSPHYDDVMSDVSRFFEEKINIATEAGIDPRCIALDPGIGFGKLLEHNLALIRGIPSFLQRHDCPLIMGISRKRFIGELSGVPVEERLPGTIAAAVACALAGARILRVHDVKECRQALQVADALGSPTP